MTRSLQADLFAVRDAVGIACRTAVGIPPSDIDAVSDRMRVDVGGLLVRRSFDPGEVIVLPPGVYPSPALYPSSTLYPSGG